MSNSTNPVTGQRLPGKVVAAYAGMTLPMSALGLPIAVYLPPFYANEAGLGLAMVGLVFTLARLWDVVTDPIMGIVIDRYPSRWGRRRHWIVLSVPILMISVWYLYVPAHTTHSAVYLGGWLLFLYIGYTFLTIAHQSWGAELADSYHERSRLYGWREIVNIAGMTSVLALPALIESRGAADAYGKIASMGWFLLLLLPITTIALLAIVPERPVVKHIHVPFRKALRTIASNRPLRRILIADISIAFGTGIAASTYIFLAKWTFGLSSHASLILLIYFLASLFAVPVWMRLCYRYEKHGTLIIAMGYACLALFGFLIGARSGGFTGLVVASIIYGVAFGAGPMILRAIMADVADVDELETGANRSGLFFALLTTTSKVGSAFSVSVSYLILDWIGFVPSASTNTTTATNGLLYTFVFVPIVFFAIAAIAMWRYPLNQKEHEKVRLALAERAKGAELL
jgi:Na+/melibiose symporter-like transporter